VLVAEGKPIPAGLRVRAGIEQHGDRLQVRVALPLTIPGGPGAETVTTRIAP
jgi:hypothetical protein